MSLTTAELFSSIDKDPRIELIPLDRAQIARTIQLTAVGEMHDRQVVSAALSLIERGTPACVLTRDESITASGTVPVLW